VGELRAPALAQIAPPASDRLPLTTGFRQRKQHQHNHSRLLPHCGIAFLISAQAKWFDIDHVLEDHSSDIAGAESPTVGEMTKVLSFGHLS